MKQTKKGQKQEQDNKTLIEELEAIEMSVENYKDEEWEMGIDEAGRGPVFGPMVYGAALWPLRFKEEIIKRGFQDSKKLTEDQRENLYSIIQKMEGKQMKFATRILDAQTLSHQQLSSIQVNLNTISHNAARDLINWAITEGYNIKTCYLDTVGPKQTYQALLKDSFREKKHDLAFIVEEKADSKYQVVSAASIVAKVQRDHEIQRLSKRYQQKVGSGYPADPTTKEWLKNSFIPIFGYSNDVRFSWQTTKNSMEENGLVVNYQLDSERKDFLQKKYHSKAFFHNLVYCDTQI